jgi:hypothetical protein
MGLTNLASYFLRTSGASATAAECFLCPIGAAKFAFVYIRFDTGVRITQTILCATIFGDDAVITDIAVRAVIRIDI